MGIAKTVNAIGDYNFYSLDYNKFAKKIGNIFEVNINLSFSSKEDELINDDICFKFNQKDTYHLNAFIYHFDNSSDNWYYIYKLIIPFHFEYEDTLELEFCPNNLFQLNFLPFNSAWQFFIDDMLGNNDYYSSQEDIMIKISNIRNFYIEICNKINSKKVILWTDAYYETENEMFLHFLPNVKYSLNDISIRLIQKDKLSLYNFSYLFYRKTRAINENNHFLDMAIIDEFYN